MEGVHMLSKMKSFGNKCLILLALVLGVGCGGSDVPEVTTPSQEAHYTFCGRLYNAQLNIATKMEHCGQYPGFDIPGFPTRAGYCGETFGSKCYDQDSALRVLEDCVSMMPVCLPQYQSSWEEGWRGTCLRNYNRLITRDECWIDEISQPVEGDR